MLSEKKEEKFNYVPR